MANKKRRVVSRKFYNQRTLHKEREYGFYWYSWLWKIIRPVLIFAISVQKYMIRGLTFGSGKG